MKNIAINGFGRIGRLAFRQMLGREGIRVVAINDLTDVATLAHLLKFDSIHGRFDGEVSVSNGQLIVNGQEVHITAERNPADLPWGELKIDVVVESTGVFTSAEKAGLHLEAGAGNVHDGSAPLARWVPAKKLMRTASRQLNTSLYITKKNAVAPPARLTMLKWLRTVS